MTQQADPSPTVARQSTATSTGGKPQVRLTLRKLMAFVAVLGIFLAILRVFLKNDPVVGLGTIYSPQYSEARFKTLKAGMTTDEVESIIGQPLRKVPWRQFTTSPDEEMWFYSSRRDETANYWRRAILVQNGKVTDVIDDFWVD